MLIVDMTPAMKAEQSRREFASNVSHELKTPLTSIHGFAEMMANHMVPTVDFDQIAQRIHMESGRLIRLIDDIIRLSQIESQGVPRTREQAALDQIAREMLAHLEPVAQQKKVTLESHLEPVTLVASGAYMEELLYNLLDNAIKYNKEGGSVTLTLEKLPKEARIIVADTGIGMEAVHLDRIFERFYRVDKSRSKQTGGTGLGLSIVKHIVENYGGTIAVESTPGQGTTFTAHLPL
jgi:two-component system phosphate regulon sensor histidine kinase PhoR